MAGYFGFKYVAGPNVESPDDITIVSASHLASDPSAYGLKSSELTWLNQSLMAAGVAPVPKPKAGRASWVIAFKTIINGTGKMARVPRLDIAPRDKGLKLTISGKHSSITHMTIQAAADLWGQAKHARGSTLDRAPARLKDLVEHILTVELDFQSKAVFDACAKLGIPCHRFRPEPRFFHFGEGRRRRMTRSSDFSSTSLIATKLAGDKVVTNQVLARNGLPVPRQVVATSIEQTWEAALELGLPVVVKPSKSNRGKGVSLNVGSREALEAAIDKATYPRSDILVEEFIPGNEYRALVANGKLIGIDLRKVAAVVGDGKHTLRDLIAIYNRNKPYSNAVVGPISLDNIDGDYIASQGHSLATVPTLGETVEVVRKPGNLSGGLDVAIDLSALHPDNVALFERTAAVVGLDPMSIDFRTPDIGRPWREVGAGICEVNSGASLRPLLIGDPDWVLDHFIPAAIEIAASTIPHIVVLAPRSVLHDADEFSAKLAAVLMARAGWEVARSTASELWLGAYQVDDPDPFPWQRYANIIENPFIDAAVYVIETAQLRDYGLGIPDVACLVRFGTSADWTEADSEILDKISANAKPTKTLSAGLVADPEAWLGEIEAIAENAGILSPLDTRLQTDTKTSNAKRTDAASLTDPLAAATEIEAYGPLPTELPNGLSTLIERAQEKQEDLQSFAIVEACNTLGVPCHSYTPAPQFLHLGEGRKRQLVQLTDLQSTSSMAVRLANNKITTNRILAQNGIPVPRQVVVQSFGHAWDTAIEMGLPLVVKPSGGNQARGVHVNVRTREDMEDAFASAARVGPAVLLETYLPGQEYRIVVAHGNVIGVTRRNHPYVVGNGESSVRELVDSFNRAKAIPDDIMPPIRIEDVDLSILAEQGHTPDSKPSHGERVQLSKKVGFRSGGFVDSIPVDLVHPDNHTMLVRACGLLGLDPAGIDFRIEDISKSWREVASGICEINSGAALRVMLLGDPRWVVDRFLPEVIEPNTCRIPHVAIVESGDNVGPAYASELAAELNHLRGWETALSLPTELRLGEFQATQPGAALLDRYRNIIECPLVDVVVYVVEPDQIRELAETGAMIDCIVHVGLPTDGTLVADQEAEWAAFTKPSLIIDAASTDVAAIAAGISDRWPDAPPKVVIKPELV